jgi:ferredoxin-NADP reductase
MSGTHSRTSALVGLGLTMIRRPADPPIAVPSMLAMARQLRGAARSLTTPLLPDDYLGLLNPLWSTRELRARVEAVHPETADAATLILRPGRDWPRHRAGQYVPLGVDVDGVRHWRTYSLTSPPTRADGCLSVTVKAIPDGVVSPHLVHRTAPGTVVRMQAPQGEFVLPDPQPARLLFLTAGSGITPVMGMLRTLATQGAAPDAVLVHSAPTSDTVIFGAELRALAARWPAFRLYERHTADAGRFRLDELPRLCTDWTERDTWACGPTGMLDSAEAHWNAAGLTDRLHVERFRPKLLPPAAWGGTIHFVRTGRTIVADGSTPLLSAGEAAGVPMPCGCRMGICYGCVAPLLAGQVRDLRTGEVHGEEGTLVQTCVSAPAGPVDIDL